MKLKILCNERERSQKKQNVSLEILHKTIVVTIIPRQSGPEYAQKKPVIPPFEMDYRLSCLAVGFKEFWKIDIMINFVCIIKQIVIFKLVALQVVGVWVYKFTYRIKGCIFYPCRFLKKAFPLLWSSRGATGHFRRSAQRNWRVLLNSRLLLPRRFLQSNPDCAFHSLLLHWSAPLEVPSAQPP